MIALLAALACTSTDAPAPEAAVEGPAVTLVYTSRLDGELEPCG